MFSRTHKFKPFQLKLRQIDLDKHRNNVIFLGPLTLRFKKVDLKNISRSSFEVNESGPVE